MKGHADVVRCLADEFGDNVNQAKHDGFTPLMAASHGKHDKVIRWLTKHGADVKASSQFGTAADVSKDYDASVEA
jgi:ankyrin repeat protein